MYFNTIKMLYKCIQKKTFRFIFLFLQFSCDGKNLKENYSFIILVIHVEKRREKRKKKKKNGSNEKKKKHFSSTIQVCVNVYSPIIIIYFIIFMNLQNEYNKLIRCMYATKLQ
ncbi:unnamed protein product [Schistosoma spindalis]|nr:unnamed protein product [Schistosoma spindale]